MQTNNSYPTVKLDIESVPADANSHLSPEELEEVKEYVAALNSLDFYEYNVVGMAQTCHCDSIETLLSAAKEWAPFLVDYINTHEEHCLCLLDYFVM